MAIEAQAWGEVRVARQVLSTIVINTALLIPGVSRMHNRQPEGTPFGHEVPRQGVSLSIKENTVSADLYIVVSSGVNIVEVGQPYRKR